MMDQSRAHFEAHFKLNSRQKMTRNDGTYLYPEIQAKWEGYQAGLDAAPRDLAQDEVEDAAKACHALDMGDSWSIGPDMLVEFAATVRAIK